MRKLKIELTGEVSSGIQQTEVYCGWINSRLRGILKFDVDFQILGKIQAKFIGVLTVHSDNLEHLSTAYNTFRNLLRSDYSTDHVCNAWNEGSLYTTEVDNYLSPEQVRFISWMYQTIALEYAKRNDSKSSSDIRLLQEAVQRRFPEYAEQILTIMANEIKQAQSKS